MEVAAAHARILVRAFSFQKWRGWGHPVALLRRRVGYGMVRPMAIPSADQVFAKWKTNTSGAAQTWAQNAEATTADPTALAIQAIPYMQQQWNAAVNSG